MAQVCQNDDMTLTLDFGTRIPTIEITLGMRLQAARKLANITQDEMAGLLGCSRRTVTRWETDQTAPPAVLLAYAVATDVNLGWLKTGKASSESDEAFAELVHPLGLEPRTHWLRAEPHARESPLGLNAGVFALALVLAAARAAVAR